MVLLYVLWLPNLLGCSVIKGKLTSETWCRRREKNFTPGDRIRDLAHQKVSSDHSAAVGGGEHLVTIINMFLLSLNVSFTFRFLLLRGTPSRVKMTQLCRELSISNIYNFFYSVVLIKLHTRMCWWHFKLRFTNDETYWSTCLSTEKLCYLRKRTIVVCVGHRRVFMASSFPPTRPFDWSKINMTDLKTELVAVQSELKNVFVPHGPLAYFRYWFFTTTYHPSSVFELWCSMIHGVPESGTCFTGVSSTTNGQSNLNRQ